MADDLGYGDISCYGSAIKTPNIDRLAEQGIRFTDFYAAAPNCSPSRAGLLTGRTPSRVGVYDYIPPDSPMHLPDKEVTIAELLKPLGYATCHVGKWHLSSWQRAEEAPFEKPTPADQGFDHWFATDNNAVPSHHNPLNFLRNGKAVGMLKGYACQLVADEGIEWLNNQKESGRPFFLNVWFNEPHRKIASPADLVQEYSALSESDALYFANVANIDNAVGRILNTLDALNLRENTLVLFTSDNGPWRNGSSGPLRAKKSSLYEGGIRVPGIMRWPGRIQAGTVSDVPAGVIDMFPSLAAATGTDLPAGKSIDGTSLLALFEGNALTRSQPLFWYFYKSSPMCVVRDGDFVLVGDPSTTYRSKSHPIDQTDFDYLKTAELARFELYNLRSDIGQTKDLAAKLPETLAELTKKMLQMQESVLNEGPAWQNLLPDAS